VFDEPNRGRSRGRSRAGSPESSGGGGDSVGLDLELLGEVVPTGASEIAIARERQTKTLTGIERPLRRPADLKEQEELLRTFRAAAKLDHPQLPTTLSVRTSEAGVERVIVWTPGITVAAAIEQGRRLESRHLKRIAEHIGEALAFAARRGIPHGDIGESAVLLTSGSAMLLGLGCLPLSALVAKPRSGPPIDEEKRLDRAFRADVYALCAMLYRLATGDGTTPSLDEIERHHLPFWLRETLRSGLADDPARRFADADDLLRALRSRDEMGPDSTDLHLSPDGEPEAGDDEFSPAQEASTLPPRPYPAPRASHGSQPPDLASTRGGDEEEEFPWRPLEGVYEPIGEPRIGGMGTVIQARERVTGRLVAIKRMRGASTDDRAAWMRFHREARNVARLNHPHILQLLQVGRDEQGDYLVLEWAAEGSLHDRVREGEALPEAEVLHIARKIGSALAYAHAKGCVHRDLKPHNVLVVDGGEPKLADFGLARSFGDATLTATSASTGSPYFMAPEQFQSPELVDARSDQFAFAKTLYHLATGQKPHTIDPAKLPRSLRGPLMRCLRDRKEDRFPDIAAFLAALERESGRLTQRIALVAVAIAICIAIAAFVMLDRREEAGRAGGAKVASRVALPAGEPVATESPAIPHAGTAGTAGNEPLARVVEPLLPNPPEVVPPASDPIPSGSVEATDPVDSDPVAIPASAVPAPVVESAQADPAPNEPAPQEPAPSEPAPAEIEVEPIPVAPEPVEAAPPPAETPVEAKVESAPVPPEPDPEPVTPSPAEAELEVEAEPVPIAPSEPVVPEPEAPTASEPVVPEPEAPTASELESVAVEAEDAVVVDTAPPPVVESPPASPSRAERTAAAWSDAIATIADRERSPHYRGLVIREQAGLVPLRVDPDTGLYEFFVAGSGKPPLPLSRGYQVDPEQGIVLVLLPGGHVRLGNQKEQRDEPLYDPQGFASEEFPRYDVELAPFFVAKFELTQFQWQTLAGVPPAAWFPAGSRDSRRESYRIARPHNPIESVSFVEVAPVLEEFGLELPTEAQWEYAARGGSPDDRWCYVREPGSPFDWRASAATLFGAENVRDASCAGATLPLSGTAEEWHDDHVFHAPVGEFGANGFGLFDVLGNVSELCRDHFAAARSVTRREDGTGLVLAAAFDPTLVVIRGGNYAQDQLFARVNRRGKLALDARAPYVGVRPVRRVY
jgi:serine/threonine protein kinase/formylglycine-generating enzyme required for sulfatase activity